MKRYIRSSEKIDNAELRTALYKILRRMWIGQTRQQTIKDFDNSDYRALHKYVYEHKTDIFDSNYLQDKIWDYANKQEDSDDVAHRMIQMYDGMSEDDFKNALDIRTDYKYVKSSTTPRASKSLMFYNTYDNEEDFKRDVDLTDEDIAFHVGESPEGYEDYKVVGYAFAKDNYLAPLLDNGYELVEIYEDNSGYRFPGYVVGHVLYDITEEVVDILKDNNYIKSSYVSGRSLKEWCKDLPKKIHTLYLHQMTGEIIGKMSVQEAIKKYGEAKVTSSYSDGDGQISVWIVE